MEFAAFVFVRFFAADIGFVYLDGARKFSQIVAASIADSMEKEPSGLLSYADLFGKLERRNSLAGGNEQIHRVKPFVQRDMRALEDSTRPDAKNFLADVAAVKPAVFPRRDALAIFADRTARAIRPTALFQISLSRWFVGEEFEKLKDADCNVIVHTINPRRPVLHFSILIPAMRNRCADDETCAGAGSQYPVRVFDTQHIDRQRPRWMPTHNQLTAAPPFPVSCCTIRFAGVSRHGRTGNTWMILAATYAPSAQVAIGAGVTRLRAAPIALLPELGAERRPSHCTRFRRHLAVMLVLGMYPVVRTQPTIAAGRFRIFVVLNDSPIGILKFLFHHFSPLALVATLIVEINLHHAEPFVKQINYLTANISIGLQVPENTTVL